MFAALLVFETLTTYEKILQNPYYMPICLVLLGILIFLFVLVHQYSKLKAKKKRGLTMQEVTVTQTKEIYSGEDNNLTKNKYVIGKLHKIGRRNGQQDSFAVSDVNDLKLTQSKGTIIIVADGMGGLSDGDKISSMVTLSFFKAFHEKNFTSIPDCLLQMLKEANEQVNHYLRNSSGKCGSTLVAGIIKERILHYVSVGDSHIYLYRGGSLLQLNREHTYREDLDRSMVNGEISREEAMSDSQRNSLTSYIGMGKLEKIDRNIAPVTLRTGDRVLFMTDGVFGTLNNKVIEQCMQYPMEECMQCLEREIEAVGKGNQDNYTAVVIECR